MLAAVGAAAMAVSWPGPDDSRSWAPLPEEVPLPAAAPDDPAAYRGVRFRMLHIAGVGNSVKTGGQEVPWLRGFPGNWRGGPGDGAPPVRARRPVPEGDLVYFGNQKVFDGRRWMVWFFRVVELPGPAPPPPPFEPPQIPPGPLMAVLDVLVLPGGLTESGFRRGCGVDDVIIVADDGWRLNRSTGRIEPTDPAGAVCPEGD